MVMRLYRRWVCGARLVPSHRSQSLRLPHASVMRVSAGGWTGLYSHLERLAARRSTSILVLSLFASVSGVSWGCGGSRKAAAPDGAAPAADAPLGAMDVTGAGGTIAIATAGQHQCSFSTNS
jgi:hypothetical protein